MTGIGETKIIVSRLVKSGAFEFKDSHLIQKRDLTELEAHDLDLLIDFYKEMNNIPFSIEWKWALEIDNHPDS